MGIVELRAGEGAPIVCVHPISGAAEPYRLLAEALETAQPVWGLTAPGLFDDRAPYSRLEALAGAHVEALERAGAPAQLIGWSFGGLLALEIARQLARQPKRVVALDTRAFLVQEDEGPEVLMRAFARDLARAYGRTLAIEPADLQAVYEGLRAAGVKVEWAELQRRLELMEHHLEAARRGLPAPYEGEVLLVRAARSGGPEDLGLRPWVKTLEVHSVELKHQELLTTGVQAVVQVMSG